MNTGFPSQQQLAHEAAAEDARVAWKAALDVMHAAEDELHEASRLAEQRCDEVDAAEAALSRFLFDYDDDTTNA